MSISDLAYTHAPIGICLLENRIVRTPNDAFAAMFGKTVEECRGQSIAAFYASQEDFESIGAKVKDALEAQGAYNDERIMKRKDGSLFWCRVRGKSLTPDNPFHCGVWTFADLSDERPVVSLTQREREIAILTCRGLTSKEIGLELQASDEDQRLAPTTHRAGHKAGDQRGDRTNHQRRSQGVDRRQKVAPGPVS